MSNSQIVVVVASNFESFIASMKSNLKLGYAKCEEATYLNGFFRARLAKEIDKNYIARLETITGTERENVLDLVSYLNSSNTLTISDEPLTEKTVKEIQQAIVEYAVEELQKEAVQLKVKRTPRGKKNV